MFHLELRHFPQVARVFNLTREELDARFVRPWVAGTIIEHDERRWAPERSRLKILEGPELRGDQLGMGRGWATAVKSSSDVTEAVLAAARRGGDARPEVDALKAAVTEVAHQPISFQDVMALAAAGHPTWRASDQLALAEQTVWEMLHQHRLTMTVSGRPIGSDHWQGVVLSWGTWAGDGTPVQLQAHSEAGLSRPGASGPAGE